MLDSHVVPRNDIGRPRAVLFLPRRIRSQVGSPSPVEETVAAVVSVRAFRGPPWAAVPGHRPSSPSGTLSLRVSDGLSMLIGRQTSIG
jgi:hypothetical protein